MQFTHCIKKCRLIHLISLYPYHNRICISTKSSQKLLVFFILLIIGWQGPGKIVAELNLRSFPAHENGNNGKQQ